MRNTHLATLSLTVLIWSLSAAGSARAQNTADKGRDENSLAGVPTLTPEMWFYQQQLRRYEDPQVAIHRKAEYRAEQRQQRLTSMRWYGLSNMRPYVHPTPWFSSYSPAWVGGGWDSYHWPGTPSRRYVIYLDRPEAAHR